MIETILKDLQSGITVVDDGGSSVGRVLSQQIASNATSIGKRVIILSTRSREEVLAELELYSYNPSIVVKEVEGLNTVFRGVDTDLVVMDSFSTMAFGYAEDYLIQLLKEMRNETRKGRSFVLSCEGDVLPKRVNSLLRSIADNLVVVKTEFVGNRITRYLYIPKTRGRIPLTKLLRFTVDEKGVQIDTRELVG